MTRYGFALVSVALFGASYASMAILTTSCTTHQCDGGDPRDKFNGRMVDADTWESAAIGDTWEDFGPQRTLLFHLTPDVGTINRTLVSTEVYVSVDANPFAAKTNWTLASGNIGEVLSDPQVTNKTVVTVHNDTCGQYFVRLVLRFAPLDGGAPGDAGPDAPDGD